MVVSERFYLIKNTSVSYEIFTIQDEIRLKQEQDIENKSFFLYVILGAFIGMFSCGRNNTRQPYFLKYGIFQAFFANLALFCLIAYLPYFYKKIKFNKDLKNKIKAVEEVEIISKQRNFELNSYFLHLDAVRSEFRYIRVSEAMYNEVTKGGNVTLVFAQVTKFLFEIRTKNETILF